MGNENWSAKDKSFFIFAEDIETLNKRIVQFKNRKKSKKNK